MVRWLLLSLSLTVAGVTLEGAPDLSGTWNGVIPGSGRTLDRDISFQLRVSDGRIDGKVYGQTAASPITGGRVFEDGRVRFVVEAQEQAGNQINVVEYSFRGELCEGGIELTREKVRARNALSGVEIPVRRESDTDEQDRARRFHSFRLEKLY